MNYFSGKMKPWLIFSLASILILECLCGAITKFSDDSKVTVSIFVFILFKYGFQYHVI
jgi:Na+/melibiose symporter-like transporter